MRSSPFALLLAVAACTPKNVPKMRCTNELLALGDPWSCVLSADRLDGPTNLVFSTESSNLVADVDLAFTVTEGALTLGWNEAGGARTATVRPDAPLALSMKVPLMRKSRSFYLSFAPEPLAVGMNGTVKYVTP